MRDLTSGPSSAGGIAHLILLPKEAFENVQKPLFLSCAEIDPSFTPEQRSAAEQILSAKHHIYHF
ncbi:hypothetical protein CALVIDRAFT_542939 [Calocera viscosa TUFC12733]|uniref:Uncharacterized protein n=1 Tax=Calocera viscosa (strain TUFC12733) TaxID=1330018 RepID=A0A167G5K0_CALVF|nr:hypothetical protein CALVIDRAFT_542939 [Calocera viscosa TUFC12733]